MHLNRIVKYRLNENNLITYISASWDNFAKENASTCPKRSAVIGTPLFKYFSSDELISIYDFILKRVRQSNTPTQFPFKCNGPRVNRTMLMSITPTSCGQLEISCDTLARVPTTHSYFGWDANQHLHACGWCCAVQVKGRWVSADAFAKETSSLCWHLAPKVSHGICPTCAEAVLN